MKLKHVVLLFIGIVVAGILGNLLATMSSVATAPGRVVQKTLQTDNIIQSYEWFYDVNAAYTTRIDQLKTQKGFLNDETDSAEKRRLRVELGAIQQTCRELATKYNANSEKMNKSVFKGWSLPDQLPDSNCN